MHRTTDDFGGADVTSRRMDDIAEPHAGVSPPQEWPQAVVWCKFMHAQARLGTQLGRAMRRECGLPLADFSVLSELEEKHGSSPVRMLDLARDLQWELSRLSHRLSHLAQQGLISREKDPHDGRGALIAITEQGRRTFGAAAPRHLALVNHLVFAALSAEQIDSLAEILDRILESHPAA